MLKKQIIRDQKKDQQHHSYNYHKHEKDYDDNKEKKNVKIVPKILKDRWQINSVIGSGSFGYIYMAIDRMTDEKVALVRESKMYRIVEGPGVPKMYWSGSAGEYNVMVLEMLGPSLEDLFNYCRKKFSLKTVLLLGQQMLERIHHINRRGIIHRDIKPDNFVMGTLAQCQQCYLIDFGLSKYYLDRRRRQHIEYREGKSLTGTARYASLRTHMGIEQSRRDDLECLGYSLIYLAKGKLPWQGIKAESRTEKQEKIYQKKLNTSLSTLCKDFTEEFVHFINYARRLGYAEEPNYSYLSDLLKEVFSKMNLKEDCE
ncbi:unnamed protein product [Didymodactylos carnosus]|uniref:non-specific serine/threonine protein kinase n=1 Tax=Didymodactylos carnosus TaxID=1234261 RepID=A0A813ULV5_9BILA|nr:unnamed protein product [Didymodactylos carnosus]CAF1159303.1 unnamed protein product [Didymodactylos carnosus]CAF3618071.1 unnamed protein product [Didymodactylos carnosus]CAF3970970.1 unnamed protein product [Didymodactylos carnosus]